MNIGIVGIGVVGKALWDYYRFVPARSAEELHVIWTYDKANDSGAELDALNKNCKVVFICVGTPWSWPKDALSCKNVYDAVAALTGNKTVVIKSTVMPGTTDDLQDKYPQHDIFYVPEFLNQDTAGEDYACPRRAHIIGVTKGNRDIPARNAVAELLPDMETELHVIDAKQAELLKLHTNARYALQVIANNMAFDSGMTQETIRLMCEDDWIDGHHTEIDHKGYRGFGGACLPKDTMALAAYTDSPLLQIVCVSNERLLQSRKLSMENWIGSKPRVGVIRR